MKSKMFPAVAILMAAASLIAGELKFNCAVDKKDAIYKAGEKITFTVSLLEDGKAPEDKFIQYRLYHDHKVVKNGFVSAAKELKIETSSKNPSWIFIEVWAKDSKKQPVKQQVNRKGKMVTEAVKGGIGTMVEPEKLLPPMAEPADFDEFWNKVKTELAAVPMKELEKVKVEDKRVKTVNIYDVKISCAGDKPVSGYLCIPKNAKPKSCPAYVSFHGAGVGSSNRPVSVAAKGLIAMDINAHGIINGQPPKFYNDLRNNYYYANKTRYAHWNRDNREKYYFKGMYMRLMRALEYIKSQPEWDGKHLIVVGGSQGGAQVIAACALDQDITFARAGVPAMCDHSGCLGNRRSGWPALYKATKDGKPENQDIANAAAYFDGAYFAKRIKCPIYINTGFMDTVCPPSSVFAAYNSIPATTEKHMQTDAWGGHATPHTDGNKALNDYIKSAVKK